MYERNAIVIDRYFSGVFGYDKKSNIKNNASNYFELVGILEKYQEASEVENNVMDEFDKIANRIKEIQKKQEGLDKKSLKYFENRKNLFSKLDEDEESLKKDFEKLEAEFKNNEMLIKENSDNFVQGIKEFNEKSEIRNKCGTERRIIESDYQKVLNVTTENFSNILKEKLKEIKSFIKSEDKEEAKIQMQESITKNGSKEKVPFDSNVINKAIDTSLFIEEKRAEILLSLYDKTSRLLNEINNDTVKIEKHKKQVKDSKSKLEFLNVISEYIILFLDNERMNTIGGEEEHKRVMGEACNNLENDLVEIQNLYSLSIKEINGKASKKLYKELYNVDYLNELKEQEVQFEKNISKLNMVGTVIYPDYWRLEGMKKIYDTFKTIMTDTYEVDLSEYEPMDITFEVDKNILDTETDNNEGNNDISETTENSNQNIENIDNEADVDKEENAENTTYEEQNGKAKEITLKFDTSEEDEEDSNEDDDEEFHWDIEDEEDEILFANKDSKKESEEDDEEDENQVSNIEIQNDEDDEDERDKEIDELLGIFDSEDTDLEEEIYNDDEDNHILQIEDDEEIDDSIFKKDEEEEEKKEKPKRKKLFGRRK